MQPEDSLILECVLERWMHLSSCNIWPKCVSDLLNQIYICFKISFVHLH